MKENIFLKVLLGIVVLALLIKLLTTVFVEPWVGRKIQAALNEKDKDYIVNIDKVHILIFRSGIVLEMITISSKREHGGNRDLNGEIASIRFKGIKLAKAIFKNEIDIGEVTISKASIKGMVPYSGKAKLPIVSHLNIRIGKVLFDKIDLAIANTSTAKAFSMKEGVLNVYDLHIEKQDTLSPAIVKQIDIKAEEILSVSSDSMYTFKASDVMYSTTSNTLVVTGLSILPNYTDYDFTARYKYQKDRIEAMFSKIYIHDFPALGYFKSGDLVSSYIEIGKMDIHVFRDNRKEFQHLNMPAFQDMIYNYPGAIRIDSISLISGNVTSTEHTKKANEPGSIGFNEINAKIYKITNDTIYKTESASLELKGEALLMGKGKMILALKAKIFDKHNTFSLNGRLSSLAVKELNPVLEKNAFIYATSGKIDAMNFSFTANNAKSTGKMTLLYHGLDLAFKNKRTDDTTALKEWFISLIANKKMIDSNPVPGERVREGIIDYERDPESFLFNYCFKSILSGIKSSLAKSPKKKKNS